MKESDIFRENAADCSALAEGAADQPSYHRYKRMEAAWLSLAEEQDWLDGEVSPVRVKEPDPKRIPHDNSNVGRLTTASLKWDTLKR
jgi:hypothetical protein